MTNNRFLLISNQRCGSTWFITSVGNCKNIKTDYEIKWSEKMLIGKASPYHLFLEDNNLDDIFNKLYSLGNIKSYGSKFVFDFYKPFPINSYNDFLNKFNNNKIIHLKRNYLDILKSKLVGRVTHILDKNFFEKNRIIDNIILDKQDDYSNIQKNISKNKKIINFNASSSYLFNLFINDVLALSLKRNNKFLSIRYEEMKNNLSYISNFLNIPIEDLKENFYEKPVIKKNNIRYEENFENIYDLKKINKKLIDKIDFLSKNNFDFYSIISYDSVTNKLKVNI